MGEKESAMEEVETPSPLQRWYFQLRSCLVPVEGRVKRGYKKTNGGGFCVAGIMNGKIRGSHMKKKNTFAERKGLIKGRQVFDDILGGV